MFSRHAYGCKVAEEIVRGKRGKRGKLLFVTPGCFGAAADAAVLAASYIAQREDEYWATTA
jgi:hypothetical protein